MLPERSGIERLRHMLTCWAQEPQRLALMGDRNTLTYSELLAAIEARESWLRQHAIRVAALALDNGPDALIWDLALLLSGIPVVTLAPFFSAEQRRHCLDSCAVDCLIGDGVPSFELSAAGFHHDRGAWWRTPAGEVSLPKGTAKVTYTSGTTGRPRGVCLVAEQLLKVAGALEGATREAASKRHLVLMPLGVLLENLGAYAALLSGAEVILPGSTTLGLKGATGVEWPRLLQVVHRTRPESLILVPQLLGGVLTAMEQGLIDARTFRFMAVGGAPVAESLLERAKALALPLYQGYGLSECASVICLNVPGANRPGSVGRPLPHIRLRLSASGEVEVAGSQFAGYLGEAPMTDEWLKTGDLGAFDDEGYLFLHGRLKHQFITGFGRNVDPGWIEAELTQGGPIAQAYVQGEGASHNAALIVPATAECSDSEIAATIAATNHRLPDYARVGVWHRLDEPFTPTNGLLTATGRLRRAAIQARYDGLIISLLQSSEVVS